jgi:hypothetical protein
MGSCYILYTIDVTIVGELDRLVEEIKKGKISSKTSRRSAETSSPLTSVTTSLRLADKQIKNNPPADKEMSRS